MFGHIDCISAPIVGDGDAQGTTKRQIHLVKTNADQLDQFDWVAAEYGDSEIWRERGSGNRHPERVDFSTSGKLLGWTSHREALVCILGEAMQRFFGGERCKEARLSGHNCFFSLLEWCG